MSIPGSPSSSTSGSYIIAEEAGIGSNGEIVKGPPAHQASTPQASQGGIVSQANDVLQTASSAGQGNGSRHHAASKVHTDGNIIIREPGVEDEDTGNAAAAAGPAMPSGFQDYDEALDYIHAEPHLGSSSSAQYGLNSSNGHQVLPPPLAYLQQATGANKPTAFLNRNAIQSTSHNPANRWPAQDVDKSSCSTYMSGTD